MKKLSLLLVLTFTLCAISLKAENDKVQFIAIHIGNADNMTVLDKAAFPDFQFYSNDETLISYTETQKMVGNPKYLMGWYGAVPEKMGFSSNYRGDLGKRYSLPYATGVLFVIDPEGTIGYQSQSNSRTNLESQKITSIVKKYKKGKYSKKLKAKKQSYIKESAIGELERTKGSDIDKDGNGLIGWDVPEITIKNENGESISLKELTDGKISIVVFFTLNGAHWKKATAKGVIEKEWDGDKLLAPAGNPFEKQFNEGEYKDKAAAKKGFAKAMFKTSISGTLLGLLVLDKEELSDTEKIQAYSEATRILNSTQDISKTLKK